MSNILVTGGTGYIGSHMVVALVAAGYHPVILDNLSNSHVGVLDRLQQITGLQLPFYPTDIRDQATVTQILAQHDISAVIHFAGLKSIPESVQQPLAYYDNNVAGSLALCQAMQAQQVQRLIFSSSAAVYGDPQHLPIVETDPVGGVTNPYGRSKFIVEDILRDLATACPDWAIGLLRYFNPVGAHPSGLIGENPRGIPNNLMPYIAQVASGQRPHLSIYGDDYPTPDGTGVRDYIHVMDLVEGHLAALRYLEQQAGLLTVNLGTGRGCSVREALQAFERASLRTIPYRIAPRRPGDVACCYADASRARTLLGWQAQRDLDSMCADAWRWQQSVPKDYGV